MDRDFIAENAFVGDIHLASCQAMSGRVESMLMSQVIRRASLPRMMRRMCLIWKIESFVGFLLPRLVANPRVV